MEKPLRKLTLTTLSGKIFDEAVFQYVVFGSLRLIIPASLELAHNKKNSQNCDPSTVAACHPYLGLELIGIVIVHSTVHTNPGCFYVLESVISILQTLL